MSSPRPHAAIWLLLSVVVIALDLWTKHIALAHLVYHQPVPFIDGFWDWTLTYNYGAAFSFLNDATGWQRWFFVGIGVVASAFIVWMLRRHGDQRLFCFALTMILGGAVGNVVDRLIHGYVVDFLQFRFAILEPLFHGGYFPSFNLADSAITLGAICLILDELLRVRRSRVA